MLKGGGKKDSSNIELLKEQYRLDNERQRQNFAAASEDKVLRSIRDLTKNTSSSSSITKTNKETVVGYLSGNILSNANNLINASRYMYYRSPIYAKMCNIYAGMYCLDCRNVVPNFSFQKGLDGKVLKQYDATLDFLDVMALNNTLATPLLNMWVCDVSFNLFVHDDVGSFFYPLDPTECVIDGVYECDGGSCFSFAVDMSKWRSTQRQTLIETFQEPLKSMYNEYERTNVKYVHCPAEYGFALKQRYETPDIVVPPLLHYLSQLANLNDLIDNQADADSLSFYKLIYLPLSTISGSKVSDDFSISVDLALKYFNVLADSALPAGVSHGIVPGDELKTIDFSDNVSEDVNRVENSQNQILGSAGGAGALLNAMKAVNNTELIKNALRAESSFVLNGVLPQIEAWTNLQLMLNLSNYCHVRYIPVTIYTKEDYRKNLLESNQYGYSYRLMYGTLLGCSERETMAALRFETEVLGLQDLMMHPLVSSHTSAGGGEVGEVGQGAPEKDPSELSPSGEKSRNK